MYELSISEKQAQVLSRALEIFARLGELPLEVDKRGWHETLEEIGELLSCHTKNNVDGYRSSWSIHASQVSKDSQIAFDLHQVVRYRLAWDKAIADGIAKDEHSPRAGKTFLVNFDEPFPVGIEPLAIIKKDM